MGFKQHDILKVIKRQSPWIRCELNGKIGFCPESYLKPYTLPLVSKTPDNSELSETTKSSQLPQISETPDNSQSTEGSETTTTGTATSSNLTENSEVVKKTESATNVLECFIYFYCINPQLI
jgi:hypothetical protein